MIDYERTLLELLARERDPQLRKVLEQYRSAEIELLAAAEELEKMGRYTWSAAVAARAREVVAQAQRYITIERDKRNRIVKLHDFSDDADTTPRGILELPAGYVVGSDSIEPAPLSSTRRRELLVHWGLHIALALLLAVTFWLLRRDGMLME